MAAPPLPPILLALAILGGCAPQGDFPSLSRRPVEGGPSPPPYCRGEDDVPCRGATEGSEREGPLAVADDAALRVRIGELLSDARRGQEVFAALLPQAEASAVRAGGSGSESWIDAQVAVSRLEGARAPSVSALASLDTLLLQRVDQPTSVGDLEMLRSAIAEAQAITTAQRAEIERLTARISPR